MAKELSITELAEMVKGEIKGDSRNEIKVVGTCVIDAYIPNKASFVKNQKYGELLAGLQNAIIIIPKNLADFCDKYPHNTYIVVEDVLNSMMDVQDFFYKERFTMSEEGISLTAKVDKSAKIGSRVYIGDNTYIGENVLIGNGVKIMHNCCILDNVTIGRGTYVYPGVCIYANCQIGDDCIIHAGVRIGVDGFRFQQDIERKAVRKWLHAGKVVVGNRVEIGANCAIDRATFEDFATVLADDVKIGDLIHIGHNSKVGPRTLICPQSSISGSVNIGSDVFIGAKATVSNQVHIGDRAKVLLNAVVAYDVAEEEVVSGFYAMPHRQWKKVWRRLKEE